MTMITIIASAVGAIIQGLVSYTCILHRHRLRHWPAERGLYEVALSDGRRFFARQQPRLYDAANRPIPPMEIPPGSKVNVNVDDAWMNAVQIVTAVDDSPFAPLDG